MTRKTATLGKLIGVAAGPKESIPQWKIRKIVSVFVELMAPERRLTQSRLVPKELCRCAGGRDCLTKPTPHALFARRTPIP